MPRPHRLFLPYCRCFSRHSPCRQGRRIPSKKPSDSQLRGSQRRRRNRRHCPVWSARRAAARRYSPPAHGSCTPVELIPPLIVLVGGRVNAEGTVRVAFGVVFLGELVFAKDFGLFCLVFAMTGVESRPMKDASTIPNSYSCRTRPVMTAFNAPLPNCRRKRSYVQ